MKCRSFSLLGVAFLCGSVGAQTLATTNVFTDIPQFGIYVGTMPAGYTPPAGVLMFPQWLSMAKLTVTQQSQLGSDLKARVTDIAGCDNYDRNNTVFYLVEPKGQQPVAADLANRITMSHFINPFDDYSQGSLATYVLPLIDIHQYAPFLADTTHDIWVGISGGANPYSGDPCTGSTTLTATQQATGFSYTLDLGWTQSAVTSSSQSIINAVATVPSSSGSTPTTATLTDYYYGNGNSAATLPITGTITVPEPSGGASTVVGTVTVNIDSHGSESEYMFNASNTLTINGAQVGSAFSTQADCGSYEQHSPDGNPYLFQNTTGSSPSNPRNWCPGASLRPTASIPGTPNPTNTNFGTPLVPQVFNNVTLNAGSNTFTLNIGSPVESSGAYNPGNGDYYVTSINFAPGATACTPTAITPYIWTSAAGWQNITSITVSPGVAVDLGPQPLSVGTWSWTGPNGYTSTAREIDSIPLSSGANTYTATYTNTSGCPSTQAFAVTVN